MCLVLLLPSLLVCVTYLVCGCNVVYVCACLMYLSVVHQAHTHTHRQHYSHIPNKRRKQAEKVVTALSMKDDVLMCLTNIFNNLEF